MQDYLMLPEWILLPRTAIDIVNNVDAQFNVAARVDPQPRQRADAIVRKANEMDQVTAFLESLAPWLATQDQQQQQQQQRQRQQQQLQQQEEQQQQGRRQQEQIISGAIYSMLGNATTDGGALFDCCRDIVEIGCGSKGPQLALQLALHVSPPRNNPAAVATTMATVWWLPDRKSTESSVATSSALGGGNCNVVRVAPTRRLTCSLADNHMHHLKKMLGRLNNGGDSSSSTPPPPRIVILHWPKPDCADADEVLVELVRSGGLLIVPKQYCGDVGSGGGGGGGGGANRRLLLEVANFAVFQFQPAAVMARQQQQPSCEHAPQPL
jgi:type II secretory pathway pseudopilin PulG